jgi:AraC family transcriptional regulator
MHTQLATRVPLFGRVLGTVSSGRARIAEHEYPAGLRAVPHIHEHSYLTVVVSGSVTERFADRTERLARGDVHFMRGGEVHSNDYPVATRCLHVELDDIVDSLRDAGGSLSAGPLRDSRSGVLGALIRDEFLHPDDLAPLAIEGLLFALLARRARRATSTAGPPWLHRVRDTLHDSFRKKVSLDELARIAEVHPAHVSREFHRHMGRTVGAYIRELRIAHACRLLERSARTIAEVAVASGFADQSHFGAAFRRTTGTTPTAYRNLHHQS